MRKEEEEEEEEEKEEGYHHKCQDIQRSITSFAIMYSNTSLDWSSVVIALRRRRSSNVRVVSWKKKKSIRLN